MRNAAMSASHGLFARSSVVAGCLLLLFVLPLRARAGAAVVEDFGYASGANVFGQAGGTGWSTPWANSGGDGSSTITAVNPLTYPGLDAAGQAAKVTIIPGWGVDLKRTFAAKTGTVYVSWLWSMPDWQTWCGIKLDGDGAGQFYIGKPGDWGTRYTVAGSSSAASWNINTVYLCVIKIVLRDGNDTVSLYVNPDPAAPEPAADVSDSSADLGTALTGLELQAGQNATLDRIRVGATWADALDAPSAQAFSTVQASRAALFADGTSVSTITVMLRDASRNALTNHTVALAQGSGSSVISTASGPSDTNGVVTFTVTDTNVEAVTYTATDETAPGFTVTQTATVDFRALGLAVGGTESTSGGYHYHVFTAAGNDTLTVATNGNVDVLVIAGGGGGGSFAGGGGGAGGLIHLTSFAVGPGDLPVTVGAGGAGGVYANPGSDGLNSVFASITALGGGGGARQNTNGRPGGSGGGGGSYYGLWAGGAGTVGPPRQGFDGGAGSCYGSNPPGYTGPQAGGGGGGAGGTGCVATAYASPGAGGPGQYFQFAANIGGTAYGYPAGWFAGGGGGASWGPSSSVGGAGGGGNGGATAVAGMANTGGGGGAKDGGPAGDGGAGGSGIVIVRYPVTPATASTVSASPAFVPANGASFATITVKLLEPIRTPLPGRTVTLTAGAGHSAISSASGVSDTNGVVTFTVTDTRVESVTYTATVTAPESYTVAQTITVQFVAPILAVGGTVTKTNGYIIHTFTANGQFAVTSSGTGSVEVLIVAGGGSGGSYPGGGGGGGGVIHTSAAVTNGTYSVIVGAGGGSPCVAGSDSVFGALTAVGGGYGGWQEWPGSSGGSGGGGGGAGHPNPTTVPGCSGTDGQGYGGGVGAGVWPNVAGGGGGGGGGFGGDGSVAGGGAGGIGFACDISGATVYYAGGGGGGIKDSDASGRGGAGGGGDGGNQNAGGTSGNPNTGSGGGGGGASGGAGGNIPTPAGLGGSGIVIVRYQYVPPCGTAILLW